MEKIKAVIKMVKIDLRKVAKPLIIFILLNIVISVLLIFSSNINLLQNRSQLSSIIFQLLLLLGVIIAFPLNLFMFQKKYSVITGIEYQINSVGMFILRLVKIFVIQFLLFLLITFGVVIILGLVSALLRLYSKTLLPIGTFALIIFGFIWMYRLMFVGNIVVFKRMNNKSGNIIIESVFLVKKYFVFIIISIVFPLLISIPNFIRQYQNPGEYSPNIFTSVLGVLFTSFLACISVFIYLNELKDNKELSIELIKEKES